MKKQTLNILFFASVVIFISSFRYQENISEKLINKIWTLSKFEKPNDINFSASKEFKETYCYQFKKNNKVIVKQGDEKNIDYEVVEGKWVIISDSILTISHKFHGVTKNEKLKIVKLTENELTIRKIPFK